MPQLELEGGYETSPQEDAASLTREGNKLYKSGNYKDSLAYFDKALEQDQNSANSAVTWNGKGTVLSELGRYLDADEAYDKAIRLNPNYIDAMVGRAMNLLEINETKRTKQALDILEGAIGQYHDNEDAWYQKGLALEALGKSTNH